MTNFPLQLEFGFFESPFGFSCLAFDQEFLYALSFAASPEEAKTDLIRRFPKTNFAENKSRAHELATRVFEGKSMPEIRLWGTSFQQDVWAALRQIPAGATTTYRDIAQMIGRPKAMRAVGTAVGANPIAFVIPCHRVLRTDGGIGGYHWGIDIKKKILLSEGVDIY